MSMSWQDLGLVIDRMTEDERNGDVHIKLDDNSFLQPVNDVKVSERSLNDEEPSVVFLTL